MRIVRIALQYDYVVPKLSNDCICSGSIHDMDCRWKFL